MHNELIRDSQIRSATTLSLQLVFRFEALDALHRALNILQKPYHVLSSSPFSIPKDLTLIGTICSIGMIVIGYARHALCTPVPTYLS